ncbi:hypothetical protein HMPREF0860_1597 [Treponema socranskii subsp. socranskii VPI DR56BR1116 = ATCC 35536]|uniref:Uncharacterized protein n=1 Tax=Treponema socranskii subsp. socranskii VPI DR56BR1116 = ATCC 35536 TaxID=1125725 RepID=U1GYZ3_TRESO|nr:hypothetical protein [Treponema socranskii]ERF61764.1 hypothetical protein HMPREF1325_1332 [Treponema socranskii subsp. socranskii VPI DR56BR1116 = ATCC 35536]ERK05096.1 hypothetical protein HMPREF0860_1597 [Treponema socranskii subsp. socranskii VPI DR56BR1116 = ATCC 35536]
MARANTIAIFKKNIDLIDEVYKVESKSAVLESNAALVKNGENAGEFIIPKIDMDGLGDYSRSDGYKTGKVDLTNETVKCDFDRGREFTVDAMDNEETAGVAFGRLASEFMRTKVVPELDAFRFAKYAGKARKKVAAALADGGAVMAAIGAAITYMDDAEVPEEGRYLFITPAHLNAIKSLDTTKSRELLATLEGRIVKIPQARFYSAIDQLDGATSGEEAGGYKKNTTAKDLNFMMVHKSALIQFSKHTVTKIFTPEENQKSDGWLFHYRSYGIAEVLENKVNGIYVHTAA